MLFEKFVYVVMNHQYEDLKEYENNDGTVYRVYGDFESAKNYAEFHNFVKNEFESDIRDCWCSDMRTIHLDNGDKIYRHMTITEYAVM